MVMLENVGSYVCAVTYVAQLDRIPIIPLLRHLYYKNINIYVIAVTYIHERTYMLSRL